MSNDDSQSYLTNRARILFESVASTGDATLTASAIELPDSTPSHLYGATNADPTTTPQDNGLSNFSPVDPFDYLSPFKPLDPFHKYSYEYTSSTHHHYPVPTPATTTSFNDLGSASRGQHYGIPPPPPPEREAVRAHGAPAREPPAWALNYKIGTGACGTVFLEKVRLRGMKSPELWAVKMIPRALPNFTSKRYHAEIKNLEALARHEWFVKFNSTYEDTHYLYIAMEYMPMGDMSQSFADGYRWNESDTRVVIKQLLHGLGVMHREGITHRDLKPENIFLSLPDDQTHVVRVKIGDFGASKRIPPSGASTYLKTTTGTQGYMAPEMHDTSKPKTNRVDIWSLGCVLYRMFAGKLLFNDPMEVLRYALTAPSSPLLLDNIGFSIPCVSFLRDILQPIPEDRPSAEDCQNKAWIMNEVLGSEYSIGMDLYTRLSKINHRTPNGHPYWDVVTDRAVDSSSIQVQVERRSKSHKTRRRPSQFLP